MKLIHQLSKETGIPIPTLRFSEKSGLIQGRCKTDVSTNNYQFYDQEAIDKLNFIQLGQGGWFYPQRDQRRCRSLV
ncbi:MerR family transcriptional regulator [Pedobacter sp. Leaf250]|uniref:MerR family transcriptional regulator n=1 Tax=Pedobacter TaxID=84567 RepID=UPI00351D7484